MKEQHKRDVDFAERLFAKFVNRKREGVLRKKSLLLVDKVDSLKALTFSILYIAIFIRSIWYFGQ